jgi:hypothetical protein
MTGKSYTQEDWERMMDAARQGVAAGEDGDPAGMEAYFNQAILIARNKGMDPPGDLGGDRLDT